MQNANVALYEKNFKEIIRALSSGEEPVWQSASENFEDYVFKKIKHDHLEPLFYYWLNKSNALESCPAGIKKNISIVAISGSLLEEQKKIEIQRLASEFEKKNIPLFLLKGAALNYTIYPEPGLRPQSDTDIFISEQDQKIVFKTMLECGYQQDNFGEVMGMQSSFCKQNSYGYYFNIDIHWKLSNLLSFADIITFKEAMAGAIKIPHYGKNVFSLNQQHTLLYACIHMVAHHIHEENLLWLYDIHLLIEQKSIDWLTQFQKLCEEKKVWGICVYAIKHSQKWYNTKLNEQFINEMNKASNEDLSIYLNTKRTKANDIIADLNVLSITGRVKYLLKRVFPSKEYMFKKYKSKSVFVLPVLYAYRFLAGLKKLF